MSEGPINVRIPSLLKKELKEMAKNRSELLGFKVTLSDLVVMALGVYVASHRKTKNTRYVAEPIKIEKPKKRKPWRITGPFKVKQEPHAKKTV